MLVIWIVLGVSVFLVIWFISIYNRFIREKNMVKEGWSGIDVQLKRRADLIPNLVEMVKGYMKHEKDLLTQVTELRTKSMQTEDVAERGKIEAGISRSLAGIFAVAEGYPELKANTNFINLQEQLGQCENEIQMARRYYNGAVRNWNYLVEAFPSVIVASLFNFGLQAFFEIEDEAQRAVPEVKF